jgi:uncharacterized protein (TIGR02300 family)
MPKEEWGVKRVCPTTGKRFYDLNKSPVVSPYTGEVVDIETARRKGPAVEAKSQAKPKRADDELIDDLDTDDEILADDDDDAELESDLLEDDDDDSVSLDDIADVSANDED